MYRQGDILRPVQFASIGYRILVLKPEPLAAVHATEAS
jgi:hypothetical protein